MRWGYWTKPLGALLIGILWGMPLWAQEAPKEDLKQAMAVNYVIMNDILMNLLLDDNYETITKDAQILLEHAQTIQKLNPQDEISKRRDFHKLVKQLAASAQNLKLISTQIQAQQQTPKADLDSLRTTAAGHFGQALMMCVACHSQFRPLNAQEK